MKHLKYITILILVILLLVTVPVSASPWDSFKQLDDLSKYQKISDFDSNSIPATSSNLNDPFQNTFAMSDMYLDDQMRQLKYSTDVASSSQVIRQMGNDAQFSMSTDPLTTVSQGSTLGSFSNVYGDDAARLSAFKYGSAGTTDFSTAIDTTSTVIGTAATAYSLSDSTFDRIGMSTQIISPPAIDSTKYTSTQFGPFGVFGGQTTAKTKFSGNGYSGTLSDQIYTTGGSIDHFATKQIDIKDMAISPGVTASGTRLEIDTIHTPLQSGFAGWANSRATTLYPSTGYDPMTDTVNRRISENMQYSYNINSNTNNINSQNTFGTNDFDSLSNYDDFNNYNNFDSFSNYNSFSSFGHYT